MGLRSFFTEISRIVGTIEDARDAGETDPLRLVDAITRGEYSKVDVSAWWELFGMDERPATKADLRAAWKLWRLRNHPDKGGSAATYRHMTALYSAQIERLPE